MNGQLKQIKYLAGGILLVPTVVLLLYIARVESKHEVAMDNHVKQVTFQKSFALDDCGVNERFARYRDFNIRVWNTYGFVYRKPSKTYPIPKAMSPEVRVEFWKLNYELAEIFGFANMRNGTGYYDVIIKAIMETALNPNASGGYGEEGILQIKWSAMAYAYTIYQKNLPDRYKPFVKFDWSGKMEELRDPILSLKAAYILQWYYRRRYKGISSWYISMYHWGEGFLGRHFRNGHGEFPTTFTIGGVKYNPILYYVTFRQLKDAFESGDLEAGKPVVAKWNRYKLAMVKEEAQLLKTHKTIRNLSRKLQGIEKKLQEKNDLAAESLKMVEDLSVALVESEAKFKEIYGKIKNWDEGNLRLYMATKGKETAKEFLKAITDNHRENIGTIIAMSIIVIGIIIGQVLLIVVAVKYVRGKRNDNRN